MKHKYIIAAVAALASLVACDKFLDTMPDNRTEIDSPEKVKALLGAAYSDHIYSMVTELLSDNMDNNRAVVTAEAGRLYQQIWRWEDVSETGNDSEENIWSSFWMAIGAANQALEAIEEMGGPSNPELSESYGEALLARAYAHFILVNVFCLQYNEETSASDQGLPYMDKPEQGLNPKYDRGNVAQVYSRIDEDIQEGLKYVGDNYDVPKYHFNKQAALAFAARFYLYYGQYEKAVKYATDCLGDTPKTFLRDYADLQANYSEIGTARLAYNSTDQKANFLMMTGYSNMGLFWGNYSGSNKHYAFTEYIAQTESFLAPVPWNNTMLTESAFIWRPRTYPVGMLRYPIFWKIDYEFEYTDPVAGIGYRHTVYPCFTADQTLLDRAEALILLKRYDEALEDLNLWADNMYVDKVEMTLDMVHDFYTNMDYYKWDQPTQKKELAPRKPIVVDLGTLQESMIHLLLNCRRTETMGQGMRWFDIKRYGITIYRRAVNSNGDVVEITDTMGPDDLRRAVQIPLKSRDAGFEPNKR